MRIIDKKETELWLSDRGHPNPEGKRLLQGFLDPITYMIPADSGKKTALSKKITSFFATDGEALLWINEWGIWPSSENQNLFYGFRRSLGESSSLIEKPGHIFKRTDLETVESLLCMVFYFIWGAVLVSPANDLVIKISHDEYIDLYVKDKKADVIENLNDFLKA